ncbi:MAG TPA: hypothetical protein VFV99_17660 [Kofleriaceae bacterium]|nr:hypothetical protein [Kofleriaceae bacterium]
MARRDHDDLDRALRAILDPKTAAREAANLLDVFRLALAVHLVAETRVHSTLLALVRPPAALRSQIAQLRREHDVQQETAERLAELEPCSDAWYCGALELRVHVLDHAKREDYFRAALDDYVPSAVSRGLGAEYATERMKLLATTSPLAVARYINVA